MAVPECAGRPERHPHVVLRRQLNPGGENSRRHAQPQRYPVQLQWGAHLHLSNPLGKSPFQVVLDAQAQQELLRQYSSVTIFFNEGAMSYEPLWIDELLYVGIRLPAGGDRAS